MKPDKPVRVRFAPSPTGFLHIGGVRTALFNWLYARHHGGTFILRLEDTDRERFVADGVEQIVKVLKWLGMEPDEGYWEGESTGDYAPYVQSERLPMYSEYIAQLIDQGLAYYSGISATDFSARREEAIQAKQPFVYRRAMEQANVAAKKGLPVRLDIRAVADKLGVSEIHWQDEVRGDFAVKIEVLDDFILMKTDGFPTYNFANVVDDHLMQISHIARGDEFISSTPKHALLYDVFGWERPSWAHLPVILGDDGAKLSKRHGDTDALNYRRKGYEPAAMLNFLALLGWNDGTTDEVFSIDELIKRFSFERVQKSPAKFDLERLNWLNGVHIREHMTEERYLQRAQKTIERAGFEWSDTARQACLLERERIKYFSELPTMIDFFMRAPKLTDEVIALLSAKSKPNQVVEMLAAASDALTGIDSDHDAIEASLRDRATELSLPAGVFFYPIRVSLTGRTSAPGIFETIGVLGIDEAKARLDAAAAKLKKASA